MILLLVFDLPIIFLSSRPFSRKKVMIVRRIENAFIFVIIILAVCQMSS